MKIRILFWILSTLGILGALYALVQLVMAICFLEIGRIVFYFMFAALLTELAILSILKLSEKKK